MADHPSVFIVVLNWNQKSDSIACLQSLQELTYPHVQVVMVDNGSSDGSQSVIRKAFPSVHLIENNRNSGCSGGRNIGWQYAIAKGADWTLFLDNDTQVLPDFLDRLVDAGEQDSLIGVVGPKITYYNEPTIVWQAGGRIDFDTGISSEFYNGNHVDDVPDMPYEVDFVPGCALMARSCIFQTVGGFDDAYFIYFEDIDWCARAMREGYRVVVAPHSIVRHKVSQSLGGPDSLRKRYYMSRNHLLFVRRHVKGMRKWLALASAIVRAISCAIDDAKCHRFESAGAQCRGVVHFCRGRFGSIVQHTH